MIGTSCPDRKRLRDCLQGRLADDESGPVFEHLQICARCETLARQLENSGDDLMDHLRAAGRCGLEDSRPSWLSRVQAAVPDANGSRPQAEPMRDEVPSVLGAYEVKEVIGRGGMGVVYRAIHQRLGKPVAVKLMATRAAPAAAARFEREMRAVGQLDHPAIVRATDAGSIEGNLFLAMELVDGVDLRRLLHYCGRLPIADACEIARQAAIGLQAAHQAGVVHRDMKPSNLMLNREGQVKILDFGLAATEAVDGGITHATSVGQVLGTLDYLAPEQVDGDAVNGRADIYALGATLFALLAGRPPLGGDPDAPLLRRLRRLALEDAPRLSELRPDAPAPLDALVAQMLARDPAARIGSAGEVAQRLAPLATGHDLAGLAERAARAPSSDSVASPDAHFASRAGLAGPAARDDRERAAGEMPAKRAVTPRRRRLMPLLALALLAGGAWWAIVILLETPQGTLRIESEVDQVRIELVDAEDRAQELEIERGANETMLRAGQYRLRLAGEHDAVAISPTTITLRKGEQEVARITRLDAAPADPLVQVAPRPERMYQGTPESVWQRQLEAELAPLPKLEAAQALVMLAGELPPERWIDRILEIGGILVEAGWRDRAYRLPLDEFRHELPDHRDIDRSLLQRTPAWAGTIANVTDPQSFREAWTSYRGLIFEQQQQLAIPPILLAERLGEAVATGDRPVSAFAAWLIVRSGMRLVVGSIHQDPAAVRSVIERLDDAPEEFERQAVLTLVASWLYEGAADEDRRRMISHLDELAERLLEDPSDGMRGEIADAWLAVAQRIHRASEAISEESAPSPPTVDAAIAARLVYQRLVASTRVALQWFVAFPRHSGFFLHEWIPLVNRKLADETVGADEYEAIVASLDHVLRARLPDDPWDVDTTARLLTERLRRYWIGENELPSVPWPADPGLRRNRLPYGLLRSIVHIHGTVPDFVRSAPSWIDEWERLLSTEIWEQLRDTRHGSKVLYRERKLTPLGWFAPYQAVQVAVGSPTSGMKATDAIQVLWGGSRPDVMLLLPILADLSGQDEGSDRRIWHLLVAEPYSENIRDILAGNTALRPIARDLLAEISRRASEPGLREAAAGIARLGAMRMESETNPD